MLPNSDCSSISHTHSLYITDATRNEKRRLLFITQLLSITVFCLMVWSSRKKKWPLVWEELLERAQQLPHPMPEPSFLCLVISILGARPLVYMRLKKSVGTRKWDKTLGVLLLEWHQYLMWTPPWAYKVQANKLSILRWLHYWATWHPTILLG